MQRRSTIQLALLLSASLVPRSLIAYVGVLRIPSGLIGRRLVTWNGPNPSSATRSGFDETVTTTTAVNFRALSEFTREILMEIPLGAWNATTFARIENLMEEWVLGNSKRSAMQVERLLGRVIAEQKVGNPSSAAVDMTYLYELLIKAWAATGVGSSRAEEILNTLQETYDDCEDPLLCGPGIESFNAVIAAYAQLGQREEAVRVFQKLYNWNRSGRTLTTPNAETYAAVLRAWACTTDPNTVLKQLHHLQQLTVTFPTVKVNYQCTNAYLCSVLEALSRRRSITTKPRQLVEQAESVLYEMLSLTDEDLRPNQWSFNFVLSAWSWSGAADMVPRAEALMERLERYHKESDFDIKTRPNAYTYNALMSCYSRSHQIRNKAKRTYELLQKMKKLSSTTNPSAEPDTVSYNIVMNAFAKSDQADAPYVVGALLEELQALYDSTGDWRRKPNTRSTNTYLDAWARSRLPEAPEQILKWIRETREMYHQGRSKIIPDKWAYNSYLQALSKSKAGSIADEAERVLSEMETMHKAGDSGLKPDVRTYTSVIHCIALSGTTDAVERAMSILNKMEAGDVRPSLYTFNCVINTIAKSKRPHKAKLALKLLHRLRAVALTPQTVSYNNVLNACAFSTHADDDPESILQIASEVLREVQEGPGANWITYQTAIRVLCKFETDPVCRWNKTREMFRQCCQSGQLTSTVLMQVRYAVSDSEYQMLVDEATDQETRKLRVDFCSNARRSMLEQKTRMVDA